MSDTDYELSAEDHAVIEHITRHEGPAEDLELWRGIHRKQLASNRERKKRLEAELRAVNRAILLREAAIARFDELLSESGRLVTTTEVVDILYVQSPRVADALQVVADMFRADDDDLVLIGLWNIEPTSNCSADEGQLQVVVTRSAAVVSLLESED